MQQYRKNVPSSKSYNDFVVFYQYVEIEGEKQPVMVLGAPKYKSAYIIPLANAYLYADSISGEPTDHLMVTAITIARALRLGDEKFTTHRIMSAIVDNLPDLISMPPAPQMTEKDVMDKAEREGLVMKLNGNTVIDAS